ncbi:MAG: DUF5666 domain-containing protein [Pseudomonadota bacterium]
MKNNWIIYSGFLPALLVGLASCSDSGSVAEGGIGGTGISMGSVTEIGSIWVNGVEYDTTGATITFADDGVEVTDTQGTAGGDTLLRGMVVRVEGTKNVDGVSGTATRVSYADNLEGPIDEVITPNTLVVLGQTVIVDNLTLDANGNPLNDVASFTAKEVVEVSGHLDANGNIRATYIEKTGSDELELKGWVDSTTPPYSFTIGALTVDTSAIGREVSDLQGEFVEVSGSSYSAGELIASSVEISSAALSSDDYDEAEMSGIVTRVDSTTSFVLGGQQVSHGDGTEFNGGLSTDIAPGVRLEVEGSLSAGVLVADAIAFGDGIELAATVLGKDETTSSITLKGLLDANGQPLSVKVDDVLTEFEGIADSFAAIAVGNRVELRARDTGTELLALKLSVAEGGDTGVVLQGPLEEKDAVAGTVTVLGVSASGFERYEVENTGTVSETEFFSSIAVGDLLELEGELSGTEVLWKRVELDN